MKNVIGRAEGARLKEFSHIQVYLHITHFKNVKETQKTIISIKFPLHLKNDFPVSLSIRAKRKISITYTSFSAPRTHKEHTQQIWYD